MISVEDIHRLPVALLNRIIQSDINMAREAYGDTAEVHAHEFPCVAHMRQSRRGEECECFMLGAARNKQPVLMFQGPNGSDIPGMKRGDEVTVGRVYTSLSNMGTRARGDSSANGWMMEVQNAQVLDLRVVRPVENGPGLAGVTLRRLEWFADVCSWIEEEAEANPGNAALTALRSTINRGVVRAPKVLDEGLTDKAIRGLLLLRGISALAKPHPDKRMRGRTKLKPRQVKRTSRKSKSGTRLAVGTAIDANAQPIAYENSVRVDHNTRLISVLCRTGGPRRLKAWIPLNLLVDWKKIDILCSCASDVFNISRSHQLGPRGHLRGPPS